MIYASVAAVVIALLAWDGFRRWLTTARLASEMTLHRIDQLEARPTYNWLVEQVAALDKRLIDIDGSACSVADRVGNLEDRPAQAVDVTEFRDALKLHENALKNFWEQVQKTCATKDELKVEIDGVKAYSTATALSGGNRFNRPRAM